MPDTDTKPSSATPSKPSSKSSGIPKNHDEWMEMNNKHIEDQAAMEAEQQAKNQEEVAKILEDSSSAPFNVVVQGADDSGTPIRLDSLSAVEVYGRKGMARYEVDPDDSYVKVVLVGAVLEGTPKEGEQKK